MCIGPKEHTVSSERGNTREFSIYRYDPTQGGEGRFDGFALEVADPTCTTILDVLIRLQREQDPTLAFRYACRVNMCGSCGMVINGREALACKTNVGDFPGAALITLRPLNHFPVIKDLVVDMDPFFRHYEDCLPFFEPKEAREEPAIIRPDSPERQAIGLATECIACGCCVSSCTMVHYHSAYAGPAPLNRAFTLLMDSRDGLHDARMERVLSSCYHCRTEFNCTEVCPKEISCTRAIKYIQRLAVSDRFSRQEPTPTAALPQVAETPPVTVANGEEAADMNRRRFLSRLTAGIGAASAMLVGGVLASAFVGPSLHGRPPQWVSLGPLDRYPVGAVSTAGASYETADGIYRQQVVKPVLVRRTPDIIVFSSSCTHLGCTVRWDAGQRLFLCACHGGAFNADGTVKSGPPPRPLDRLEHKVDNGNLLVKMV
jgi:succinate dehydrogenase / fumarate reductase, iron-sulfur subunit